ncbi:hypothetical protein BH09ACT7_BH09ACT7_10870 [soil metagenome]
MGTMIDVESRSVTGPSERHPRWPWAALGLGAAIVIVGGVLFTPPSDGAVPGGPGAGQISADAPRW